MLAVVSNGQYRSFVKYSASRVQVTIVGGSDSVVLARVKRDT